MLRHMLIHSVKQIRQHVELCIASWKALRHSQKRSFRHSQAKTKTASDAHTEAMHDLQLTLLCLERTHLVWTEIGCKVLTATYVMHFIMMNSKARA